MVRVSKIRIKNNIININMLKNVYLLIFCSLLFFILILYFLYDNQGYNYIWSKRFNSVDKYNLEDTEYISMKKIIKDQINNSNKYLWIRNTSNNEDVKTDLDYFGELISDIKRPIILITSDGDRSVPSSYNKDLVNNILSSPKIIKWYTQNYDKTIIHPKLDYYPIGLDLHTKKYLNLTYFDKFRSYEMLRSNKFNYYLKIKNMNSNKINKIFCDSHLSLSHPRRSEMYDILKDNQMINFLNEKVSQSEIIKKYAEHKFVLSPRGNGIDCHRTWEIFLLGSIVITETSSLDDMYISNNLPVIILKDFSELNKMDYNDLDKLWEKNKHKCDENNILKKFDTKYWVK